MALSRSFFVSASTLITGTVVAQAITFGLSFVLARLYAPGEFGKYSIFVGMAAIVGLIGTGAFDRAILLGKAQAEARRAATLVLMTGSLLAILAAATGAILWATGLLRYLPFGALDVIVLLPLFTICFAAAQVMTYATLRGGRSRHLATMKVGQSVTMAAVQVTLTALGAHGLMVGYIAGWFVLAAGGVTWRIGQGSLARDLRARPLRSTARRHWRYPRYVLPNEILDGLSNQVPLFLIGTCLSMSTAGHYGLALMALAAPAALIGQATGQAFLQIVGPDKVSPAQTEKAVMQIWLIMAVVGLVPFGTLLILGPDLFAFGFGAPWRESGTIAQFMVPLVFVRFISSPTSTLYWKLGMQREQWRFSVAAAMYRTAAYSLLFLGLGVVTAITVHVVIEAVAILAFNGLAIVRLRKLQGDQVMAAG